MEAISNAVESLRQSPVYAPVGIILGAFAWFALKKISEHIPCVDAAQLRKTLLALIFSGMKTKLYQSTHAESPQSEAFAKPWHIPVGIILGAIPWLILMKITEKIPCVDAAHLRKTLLAFLFTGAYFYIWAQGSNPHDAEIKENTLHDQVFLFLAGGYYVLHIYPQKFRSTSAHHFISIIAIICVIIEMKGASAANTFGFLVEAPNVFFALRGCIAKLECCALDIILNIVYPLIFILAKLVALGYHTYRIVDQDVSSHLKVLAVILALFSFVFIAEIAYLALKGDQENKKDRSKSSSKSRSRSKSKARRSRCCQR